MRHGSSPNWISTGDLQETMKNTWEKEVGTYPPIPIGHWPRGAWESGSRHPGLEVPTGPAGEPSELGKDLPHRGDGETRTEPRQTQKCSKEPRKEPEGKRSLQQRGRERRRIWEDNILH